MRFDSVKKRLADHGFLITLVFLSIVARCILIVHGGQFFWPDEYRYIKATNLLLNMVHGQWGDALRGIAGDALHPFFTLVAIIPAFAQYVFNSIHGLNLDYDVFATSWLPAMILSLASVLNILLVYDICRRSGGDRLEASIAAFLMFSSNTMFYYARHLLPYDCSLAIALLALRHTLGQKERLVDSIICGILAGLSYLTYSGHVALVAVIMVLHVLHGQGSWASLMKKAAGCALGFALPVAALELLSRAAAGKSYLAAALQFSGTAQGGAMAEGWSLPWEYLWSAEGLLVLVWVGGIGFALWTVLRKRAKRPAFFLAGALGIYAMLVLMSTGLGKFVVYGRAARAMVPFLSLVTAYAVANVARSHPRRRVLLIVFGVCLLGLGAFNMQPHFTLIFPDQAEAKTLTKYGRVRRALTFKGPVRGEEYADPKSQYVLVNAQVLMLVRQPIPIPQGEVIERWPHALVYRPYQYEGYNPLERRNLRDTDISIRLIKTDAVATAPASAPQQSAIGDTH